MRTSPAHHRFFVSSFLVFIVLTASQVSAQTLRIAANDNRRAAGFLRDGVLTLKLEAVRGMWFPDGDNDPGIDHPAFAERGRAPSIPGPLIRVPVGTEIRTTITNALDSAITIEGLNGARTIADTVRLQPGESRELITHATSEGTFLYYAYYTRRVIRTGEDRTLAGAFVVDPPNAKVRDRVLVLAEYLDTVRFRKMPGMIRGVLTINGKSWPNTERLSYKLGDTIRWRVVNTTLAPHPMHLHGAYFTILSKGGVSYDSAFAVDERRLAVTERLQPLTTMSLYWAPDHAGNWLFHCHITPHIMAHVPLADVKASDNHADAPHGMSGLVMGTTVTGPIAKDVQPARKLRLVVEQYDSIPGELGPRFSYEFDDARSSTIPGPTIVAKQNEPIAITVVNHAKEATSVHWHGLEIQSYYDGVPRFGGDAARNAPLVMPNDSFVVKMVPPRAGTFIYHAHADELRQQGGGLYGAFIVKGPGTEQEDRTLLISSTVDTSVVLINGFNAKPMEMKAGQTYRLRMIQIALGRPSIFVTLKHGEEPVTWRLVARDGADLPTSQVKVAPAKLQITTGQTWDALFTPSAPGDYSFEVLRNDGFVLKRAAITAR